MVLKIKRILNNENINVHGVIKALCSNDSDKLSVFSTDNAFQEIQTVEKLLLHVGQYCSIFDFDMLDVFVQATECQEAINVLKDFTELLQNSASALKEVDLMSKGGELLDPTDFSPETYKFVIEYVGETGSLKAQEIIKHIIEQRVGFKSGTLIFKGFSTGNIFFVYQVSEPAKLHLLQYKFTNEDRKLFAAYHIQNLTVDDTVILASYALYSQFAKDFYDHLHELNPLKTKPYSHTPVPLSSVIHGQPFTKECLNEKSFGINDFLTRFDAEEVEWFLNKPIDKSKGNTIVHEAVLSQCTKKLEIILKHGGDHIVIRNYNIQ